MLLPVSSDRNSVNETSRVVAVVPAPDRDAGQAPTFVTGQAGALADLGTFFSLLRWMGLWLDRSENPVGLPVVLLLGAVFRWLAVGAIVWSLAYAVPSAGYYNDMTLAGGYAVAGLGFCFMGLVALYFFTWSVPDASETAYQPSIDAVKQSAPLPALLDSQLVTFGELLNRSEKADVEKFGSSFFWALVIFSGPIMLAYIIIWVLTGFQYFGNSAGLQSFGRVPLIAVWYPMTGLFAAYAMCLYGCMLCGVWLLRCRLLRFSEWSVAQITRRLQASEGGADPTGRDGHSLDFIVRERYLLSAFTNAYTNGLGRAMAWLITALILFGALTMGRNATADPSITLFGYQIVGWCMLVIFLLLWTMAILGSGDMLLLALVDFRGRFPCDWHPTWRPEFGYLRTDLDSIINHCKNTPIGFRIFGVLITQDLVQGITYSTVVSLGSYLVAANR